MTSRRPKPQVRRRRARNSADAEQSILDAAARLFRRQGFAATGLREIAAEAGILLGSVQYRFKSKELMLARLMERAVDNAMAAVRAAVETTRDPMERVRLGLGAHLRALLSGDDAVYVLLYDWRVLQGDARTAVVRLRDRYEAFWDGILFEAAGAGSLRAELDPRFLRLVGFGAINWVATWYRADGPMTPEQIADAIFQTMALGIASDNARLALGRPRPGSKERRVVSLQHDAGRGRRRKNERLPNAPRAAPERK